MTIDAYRPTQLRALQNQHVTPRQLRREIPSATRPSHWTVPAALFVAGVVAGHLLYLVAGVP